MAKKAKIIVLIFAILFAVGVFAFITGANSNSTTNDNTTNDSLNVTNNDSVNGTDIVNAMDNSTLPETIIKPVATGLYPQYTQPDIELQTSYISDTLYAGTTYTYKVQIKNIGDKDVTIDPRLNAGYPIIYPMAATGAIASTVTNVEVSNSTANNTSAPTPIPTPVPVSAPVINSASTTSAVPNMVAGSRSNGQAFDNDAVNISAPSIIPAGQIVNMTIMVTVPDNSTGSYYTSVDMNVNNVENDPSRFSV